MPYRNRYKPLTAEDARYYKDQFETLQRECEDRMYREAEARQRREREAEESRERDLREPRDWFDAFYKGRVLIRREARLEAEDNAKIPDQMAKYGEDVDPEDSLWKPHTYFAEWVKQLDDLEGMYRTAMVDAEKRVEQIRAEARARVARAFLAKYPDAEEMAKAMESDNFEYLTNW